jgi:hypothetical protein
VLQVAIFDGRASIPLVGLFGLDRFQKSFWINPSNFCLVGRVMLNRGAVGDTLYPLYFQADVQKVVVPSKQPPIRIFLLPTLLWYPVSRV